MLLLTHRETEVRVNFVSYGGQNNTSEFTCMEKKLCYMHLVELLKRNLILILDTKLDLFQDFAPRGEIV